MTDAKRTPKLMDYLEGAILTNGLASVAIYLAVFEPLFELALIPLWCLSAGVATYLVCMRTTRQHLLTGAKTAVVSIVLGVLIVPILQGLDLGSILVVLACFFVGSVGGAYYALRTQLRRKKHIASPPHAV
jgi:uncharacterized membrane-anchored protein